MSVSALTTAMAVAAAAVPNGEAPASVATFGSESVAVDRDPPIAGSVEVSPPALPAQSKEPPQSTEPAHSADSAQAAAPASSAPPESQPPAPAARPGEIVVTGRRASPDDPLEELNSKSFDVTQSVDKAIVAPVAFAYKEILPRPVRSGLRNFLHNLGEPIVFLNFMLQLKPGKAAETFGRFAINTTLGAAGLVDVAKRKPFNLPYRRNGFANTLGYYGVKPGPYFYLPLVGSTTLRDFIGNRLDQLILPLALGRSIIRPEFAIPIAILGELDYRIEFHGRTSSTIKSPVQGPASSGPAPAPTPPIPVQDPPQVQIPTGNRGSPSIGGTVDRQPVDTGDLLYDLSIFGLGQYSRLVGDFKLSPIIVQRGNASQWAGAMDLAYTW